LARAVYSKEKLLLLDDCFSGLDATAEDRIFNRLLGRTGLLRKNGITVVLVTHAAHRLPFANVIIVLDGQGHLAEQGTFQHLMDRGTYLPSITAKFSIRDEENETVEPVITAGLLESLDDGCEEAAADTDRTRSAGDWTTYVHYFRSCGWVNTICFGCGLAGFAVFMRVPGMISLTRSHSAF
jgi:ABC-type multidrug transport system ATPase subunit